MNRSVALRLLFYAVAVIALVGYNNLGSVYKHCDLCRHGIC